MKPVTGDLSLTNRKRYSQNIFKIDFELKTAAKGKFSTSTYWWCCMEKS